MRDELIFANILTCCAFLDQWFVSVMTISDKRLLKSINDTYQGLRKQNCSYTHAHLPSFG